MTRLFLIVLINGAAFSAFGQSEAPTLLAPNPSPTPKHDQENAPLPTRSSMETAPDNLSQRVLQDMTRQTNDFLGQKDKPQLSALEIQELTNIIEGWSNPVHASVFLYFLIFSAIIGHAFVKKHYKWCIGMVLFGAVASALAWLPPISYTRRHIFPGIVSQQLPVILIQILPTFVWWAALADIGHWFERIIMSRGLG